MKSNLINTSNNKFIKVYDGLFTRYEMTNFYTFMHNSFYKVDGYDCHVRSINTFQIYASYSIEELINMKFLSSPGYKMLDEDLNLSSKSINQIRVNLNPPFERNTVHTDDCSLTLLYYPLLEWKLEYSGATLFLDDAAEEPIYTSLYKPGRVIVFDGNIPHLVLPSTSNELGNRMSFAIQYG